MSRFWWDLAMVKFYFRFVHPMINRLFLSKSLWKFTFKLFFIVSVCLPSSNVIQWESPLDFQVRSSRFWGDIAMVKFYFRFVHPMTNRLFLSKSLWKFTCKLFFIVSVCLPSSNVIQWDYFLSFFLTCFKTQCLHCFLSDFVQTLLVYIL